MYVVLKAIWKQYKGKRERNLSLSLDMMPHQLGTKNLKHVLSLLLDDKCLFLPPSTYLDYPKSFVLKFLPFLTGQDTL